jgi:8-amino-3,8-dideoxy-alpha-D-manno-octulosonate transaminase
MSRTVSTAISLLWTEEQIKEKGEKMLAAIIKAL